MIIVTGTLAFDYIMDFPGVFRDHILPTQLHNLNISFNLRQFKKRRGGTAGNVSYSMGLLKTPHILLSVAGRGFGEYKTRFKRLGIQLDHVIVDRSKKISTGFAITDRENNQIWGFYYGAAENLINLSLDGLTKKGDLVLVGPSGAEATAHMARECVRLNIDYMLDPGMILSKISPEDLTFGVMHAKYIIGSDYEISLIQERVKDWETYFKDKIVITTLGEKGSIILDHGKEYIIGVAKPKKVVDPTGAGDAWRAGFLVGLEKGLDVQKSGQMGSVAASFSLEKYGTQEHIYTLDQFLTRYKNTFGEPLEL